MDYHAARLSAGAIAEQDLLRVQLEHERLKISADLAAIDANRARVDLLKEMGQTDFPDLLLTEPLAVTSVPDPPDIEQVLSRRADIKAARAALEQARANARVQDVAARPDLNLTYGYKRNALPRYRNRRRHGYRIHPHYATAGRQESGKPGRCRKPDVRRAQQQVAAIMRAKCVPTITARSKNSRCGAPSSRPCYSRFACMP